MAENILADNRHTTTREDIRQAIQQRTTRGMLTYNSGKVHYLGEGDLWAVPSTRGGFYQVDLLEESCSCADFTFYGSLVGVACRHIYDAAIARARGRRGDRGDRDPDLGGPQDHGVLDLGDQGHGCYSGVVYMGQLVIGEDGGEEEALFPVLCRRCYGETL